jgi:DNA helicase-2/ATP-dependent DNA helicase PcrA
VAEGGELTLAVAGSRKTQSIVDACQSAPPGRRILVVTYTLNNQAELRRRLNKAPINAEVEVSGWFTFLIDHFIRPYLPFEFPSQEVTGFDEKSTYQVKVPLGQVRRYFTVSGSLRSAHAAHLAHRLAEKTNGLPLRRLEKIYDEVYIDEVQDLGGYDLEILESLISSAVALHMVGDVRQAILSTSLAEPKNKKYRDVSILRWFQKLSDEGRIVIHERNQTWRCRAEIAAFADTLFDPVWGFAPTVSLNNHQSGHDGIFLVRLEDVDAYLEQYSPQPLRWSAASWKTHSHLAFINFGASKGLTRKRVLIFPTDKMLALLARGTPLEISAAARLYVGVTRAEQSVAFVVKDLSSATFPIWDRHDS